MRIHDQFFCNRKQTGVLQGHCLTACSSAGRCAQLNRRLKGQLPQTAGEAWTAETGYELNDWAKSLGWRDGEAGVLSREIRCEALDLDGEHGCDGTPVCLIVPFSPGVVTADFASALDIQAGVLACADCLAQFNRSIRLDGVAAKMQRAWRVFYLDEVASSVPAVLTGSPAAVESE